MRVPDLNCNEGSFEVTFTVLDETTATPATIFWGPELDLNATRPRFRRIAEALDCRLYAPQLVGR
jgi:hypothetical protein